MEYLITSSLLDSYDWLKNCPKRMEDKALDDFVAMVNREPRPTSAACQRGIDFERLVCDHFDMSEEKFKELVRNFYPDTPDEEVETMVENVYEIFTSCNGGKQQVPVMKQLVVDKMEFHLFGYADIVLPDKIIDIKTTGNFRGVEYYENRSQHYLYSLCTGINVFEYLIADFGGKKYPKSLERVWLSLDPKKCEEVLIERIREIVRFFKISGLWEPYVKKFTALHKDYK